MRSTINRQTGFSLIELLISLVVGLAILAGLSQVFVAGQSSYSLQDRFGALQENGRYALYFLQRDIRNAGLPKDDKSLIAFDLASTVDGGGNAADRIGVRYRATTAGTDCLGAAVAVNTTVLTTYQLNVDGVTGVSRLMCAAQGQPQQPLVDGIENLQIQYGVDLDVDPANAGFGYADYYVPANAVTAAQWLQQVVSVRVAVLASAVNPVTGDKNDDTINQRFTLLDAPPIGPLQRAFPFPSGQVRGIRARVFTSTVEVRNRTSG